MPCRLSMRIPPLSSRRTAGSPCSPCRTERRARMARLRRPRFFGPRLRMGAGPGDARCRLLTVPITPPDQRRQMLSPRETLQLWHCGGHVSRRKSRDVMWPTRVPAHGRAGSVESQPQPTTGGTADGGANKHGAPHFFDIQATPPPADDRGEALIDRGSLVLQAGMDGLRCRVFVGRHMHHDRLAGPLGVPGHFSCRAVVEKGDRGREGGRDEESDRSLADGTAASSPASAFEW